MRLEWARPLEDSHLEMDYTLSIDPKSISQALGRTVNLTSNYFDDSKADFCHRLARKVWDEDSTSAHLHTVPKVKNNASS
jgi:hypothetical protein